VIDREAPKTIKLAVEGAPVALNLWIQLLPAGEGETKMKLTARADLNPFIKGMVSKPLQDGVNKMADALTVIPYNDL
jgi:carbon monoxide dehydrogenase subunit G